MPTQPYDIEALLHAFPEEVLQLGPDQQRLSLGLYRLLAKGQPVDLSRLANAIGLQESAVEDVLRAWPGVYYDDDRCIIGYWGLALPEMDHRFEVEGKTLYTWCAWDSLFLPELIQQTARVESTCPVTEGKIRLLVSPNRIENRQPTEPVMSFLRPHAGKIRQDVIQHFCHYVHFFSSAEAGAEWVARHEGTFVLSLDQAGELARRKNQAQYGSLKEVGARG